MSAGSRDSALRRRYLPQMSGDPRSAVVVTSIEFRHGAPGVRRAAARPRLIIDPVEIATSPALPSGRA